MNDEQMLGTAIAGAAIAASLIDTLLEKGTLTLGEARGVVDRARNVVGRHSSHNESIAAQRILADWLAKHPEKRL